MKTTISFMVALVTILGSCSTESTESTALPTVRDSAGIMIVENTAPQLVGDAAWRLDESPQLTIGGEGRSPGAELYRVANAIRLDNGHIVVANAGTGEIRFYDQGGMLHSSVGGQGGGPGEFQSLAVVRRYGSDSIVAFDAQQRRMTFYDLHGNMGRVTSIRTHDGADLPVLGPAFDVFEDGTFFVARLDMFSGEPQNGLSRGKEPTFRIAADGTVLNSLGSFPGREIFFQAQGGGFRTTPRIFGYSTTYTVTSNGFFAGTNDRYEISHYGTNGVVDMIIRTDYRSVPVGAHHRELFMQIRTADMSTENRLAYEKRYEISQPPPTFPAFENILTDQEGNLWVGDYLPPDQNDQRFAVFDLSGRWITDVDVPDGISVMDIGSDYVLAMWADELDVEHVEMFHLLKKPQE